MVMENQKDLQMETKQNQKFQQEDDCHLSNYISTDSNIGMPAK